MPTVASDQTRGDHYLQQTFLRHYWKIQTLKPEIMHFPKLKNLQNNKLLRHSQIEKLEKNKNKQKI